MKKFIVLTTLCTIAILFQGCSKSKTCSPTAPSAESPQILAYAAANSMSVTAHPSGLYYEIITPGSGG
ncbi:MAG: hypothetical protein ABIR18_06030, partial [Chitinophagaceae bacterium]